MRCLIVFVLYSLLANPAMFIAQGSAGEVAQTKSELAIVGKNDGSKPGHFLFKMGECLQIRATGELFAQIVTEWGKTKTLTLYFEGERIADLTAPPQQVEAGKELLLNFELVRNAENDANRQAWDRLLKKKHGYRMTIQPALAIGNDLPLVVQSSQPFQFYVASDLAIWFTLIAGLIILTTSYWLLVKKTKMLCDTDTGYYSLGKSQMAFWGLLVVLSFSGVWILTGTMERIPPQILILLGISGATGLSAMVIGNNKKSAAQKKIKELQQEQPELAKQNVSDTVMARRKAIKSEIDSLPKQPEDGQSNSFWRDICDDGNGLSFHRFQVVLWTVVLGAVFVRAVAQVMSMPEFPDTLLTLLGISNATYLGFKIPEKQ